MYTLQTFFTFDTEVDNTRNVVSPFGELSSRSRTYVKDIYEDRNDTFPGVVNHVMGSYEDDTWVNVDPQVLEVTYTVMDYIRQRGIAGNNTGDSGNLLANVEDNFNGVLNDVEVGAMVSNGVYWMPGYISAEVLTASQQTRIRIFFADESFKARFNRSEIVVIHPVDDIDSLRNGIPDIVNMTKDFTPADLMQKVNTTTDPYPYTSANFFSFDVVNPAVPTEKVNLTWAVAIHGIAGNNIDSIYKALRDKILEDSQYDESYWADRIPDLFKTIEFTIIPLWHNRSVPQEDPDQSLFSPVSTLAGLSPIAQLNTPNIYNNSHVTAYTEVGASPWKSLSWLCVSNPDNRNNVLSIKQMYPDYALLDIKHNEFGRISPITREFIVKLVEALAISERVTPFSTVPEGLSMVTRDGKIYVVFTHQTSQFYVTARVNYESV
jgi:hypothetical protein